MIGLKSTQGIVSFQRAQEQQRQEKLSKQPIDSQCKVCEELSITNNANSDETITSSNWPKQKALDIIATMFVMQSNDCKQLKKENQEMGNMLSGIVNALIGNPRKEKAQAQLKQPGKPEEKKLNLEV